MATAASTKVPKGLEEIHAALTDLTDRFCAEHLNQEYAELAHKAIMGLCRKRPSPLVSGSAKVWACGIVLALGQMNFLTDRSKTPSMSTADLRAWFGAAESTATNKAKQIKTLLSMRPFDHKWMLPSRVAGNSLVWLIEFNGLIVDARQLPVEVQEAAVKKGLIPFIHTWEDPKPG